MPTSVAGWLLLALRIAVASILAFPASVLAFAGLVVIGYTFQEHPDNARGAYLAFGALYLVIAGALIALAALLALGTRPRSRRSVLASLAVGLPALVALRLVAWLGFGV